jgi:hypothetical protein
MTVAEKIDTLRKSVATATQRRSDAMAAHKVAQKQLTDIDKAIVDLGFDPDMSETQLAALEAKLDADLDAAMVLVAQEIASLDAILSKAKAAGVL